MGDLHHGTHASGNAMVEYPDSFRLWCDSCFVDWYYIVLGSCRNLPKLQWEFCSAHFSCVISDSLFGSNNLGGTNHFYDDRKDRGTQPPRTQALLFVGTQ